MFKRNLSFYERKKEIIKKSWILHYMKGKRSCEEEGKRSYYE